MPYRVLVNDLTVNSDGPAVTDLFGNVLGYQQVSKTYPKGYVLDDAQVGDSLRESVDKGDADGYLEKVGDSDLAKSREAQEPFPGYSDMSVEQVQVALKFLPSDAVRSIVKFEEEHGENRAGIVDWHIGRGEAYTDRLTGRAGSPGQDETEKENLSAIVTRDVTENDFTFGESMSDDGQPQVDFGAKEGDSSSEGEKVEAGPKQSTRRGRRATANAGDSKPAAKPAPADDKN